MLGKKILSAAVACLFVFGAAACSQKAPLPPKEEDLPQKEEQTLTFDEDRGDRFVNWFGRCYWDQNAQKVCFSNSSAGFEVRFEGTKLVARISASDSEFPQEAKGSGYAYVFVDGKKGYGNAKKIQLSSAGISEYVLAENLPKGEHTLRVLKCTEAKYGSAYLHSLYADGVFLTPPARAERRVELIGDSILSGSEAMRESTTADSKMTESENSLASYGYLAAEMLDAEVSAVTRSGMLVSGYGGYATVQDYYDVYGSDQSAAWDFSSFAADVIILDLGTNDSFIGAPADFILEKYVSFLAHLREKNPNSFIFCCAGAMVTSVNGVVAEAVAQRNSDGDENVWFYALPTITKGGHPHEEEHMFNGYSLSAFIRQTLGWIAEI